MNGQQSGAAPRFTLGGKLLVVVLTFTALFAANFLAYGHLLGELDRTAAAVDAAGRQRMLSQKIAYLASQISLKHDHDRAPLKELAAEFQETLEAFKRGGPSRSFYIHPAPGAIAPLIGAEEAEWKPYKDAALLVAGTPVGGPGFKKAIGYIEAHSEALLSACDAVTAAYRKTAEDAALRMGRLMALLIGLSLLFSAWVFYYARRKIVALLVALDKAAAQITAGSFPELADGDSGDEVGNLFRTFSGMSATMRRDLEKRSAIAGLLAISLERGSMAELLGRFLEYLLALPWLALEAKGAIFLADPAVKDLVMAAQRGMPDGSGGGCANVPFGDCLCGSVAASGKTVFTAHPGKGPGTSCPVVMPHGHYCLPIKTRNRVAGVLSLYAAPGHNADEGERAFLEAACSIIAKTIEYKNLETRAQQSQKMESLGKTAGAIAHDFNNILTATRGFNDLVLEVLPADSEGARFAKETAAGLNRGTALVTQLLAFSRNQPAEMAPLDLNALIAGMGGMLEMVIEKKVRLKLSLAAGLPPVSGNKGQLGQVLVNLAVNARDAILPGSGELSIATSEITGEQAGTCSRELAGAARVVRLTVSDTGCGMTEEVIEHIFEPFFTTKPDGKGTGLGLATVYSLVKLHKGGINITSRPGKGTTFDICFPAAE